MRCPTKMLALVISSLTAVLLSVTPQVVIADAFSLFRDDLAEGAKRRVVRVVAKHPMLAQASQLLGSGAQELTFGLSAHQRNEIYALSGGQIDLRGMYLVYDVDPSTYGFKWAKDLGSHSTKDIPPHWGAPVADPTSDGDKNSSWEGMDPDLNGQWWTGRQRIDEVWQHATGKGVTIADCDTGFYVSEGDLFLNLNLEYARDFSDTQNPLDVSDGKFVFHGTAVAALIAGVRDDRGTNGIAFNSRLVPLQYYNFDPALDRIDKEEATARCIINAIKIPHVRVIVVQNQTLAGSAETFAGTREAVKLAMKAGITVVAAAGNSSVPLDTEARYNTGSVIVGALNADGSTAAFSNYGRRVTIAAYGERLYTLYGPQGRMDTFGGTTAAAAQVAATVALMLEVNPTLTNYQIKTILERTSVLTEANRLVGGELNILDAVVGAKGTSSHKQVLEDQARFRSQIEAILD